MLKSKLSDWIVMTTRDAAWAPSLVFLVHAVASLGFRAYQRWPSLDIPMHFLGGVVICYFYHRASINASTVGLLGPFHLVTHLALVFAMVATTTVFWEFAEYISDQVFGTHARSTSRTRSWTCCWESSEAWSSWPPTMRFARPGGWTREPARLNFGA